MQLSLLVLLPLLAPSLAHNPATLTSSAHHHLNQARSLCSRSIHCILASEATEGPYYIPHPLIRSNITEDRPGIPFTLQIHVLDVANCTPAQDAWVDIWHADASGEYSGWAQNIDGSAAVAAAPSSRDGHPGGPPGGPPRGGPGGPGGPGKNHDPIESSRWLRGVAKTGPDGLATFETVMPGWYEGRSTHIHIRVHNGNVSVEHGELLGAGNVAHTGQLFFADALIKRVAKAQEPYISRARTLTPRWNGDDGIFLNSGGAEQVIDVEEGEYAFVGAVTVGIDSEATHNDEDAGGPMDGSSRWKMLALAIVVLLGVTLVIMVVRRYFTRRRSRGAYAALQQEEEQQGLEGGEAAYRDRS